MRHTQFIGFSAAAAAAYVGYPREIIVETGAYALRVMDGVVPGGYRIQALAGTITMVPGVTLTVGANASLNQDASTAGSPNFAGLSINAKAMAFPGTPATVARTDAGQTFTGTNAFGAITATTIGATSVQFGAGTVLSNYQEGTWTPVDSSGAGLVFTNIACDYTRIGNRIFATGNWTYPATGNTNGVSVGGLPLTSGSLAAGAYCGSPILTDLVNANWFVSFVGSNSALINLTNQAGSAGVGNNVASTHAVRISLMYHV